MGRKGGGVYFLFFFLVQSLPLQLAQAKNGDEQFWKPKIHATNGYGEPCTLSALILFSFKLGGGGGGEERTFYLFSFVPNMFLLCCFQVPNGFLLGFQRVPQRCSQ